MILGREYPVNPEDPHLTPDSQAEEILRQAEADAMSRPVARRPRKRLWWYRGFTGREADWLDAFTLAVIASTVILIVLGIAGVL